MPVTRASRKRARVLVIEDDAGAARGLRTLLASRGFLVDLASEAGAAVRQAAGAEYGLVVADLDVGGQGGTEMLSAIRLLAPEVPMLVVTAQDRFSVLPFLRGVGLEDCLEKPVRPDALLAAVEERLLHRR